MPDVEEENKSICYITGEIQLDFHPPNHFDIEPKVTVDMIPAFIKPTDGEDPKIWKYLAVVEKGRHDVEVVLGNVTSSRKNLMVRGAQTTILNFHFTSAS